MELRNFRRRRHLYSAGRPSRWASAHILVFYKVLKSSLVTCSQDARLLRKPFRWTVPSVSDMQHLLSIGKRNTVVHLRCCTVIASVLFTVILVTRTIPPPPSATRQGRQKPCGVLAKCHKASDWTSRQASQRQQPSAACCIDPPARG